MERERTDRSEKPGKPAATHRVMVFGSYSDSLGGRHPLPNDPVRADALLAEIQQRDRDAQQEKTRRPKEKAGAIKGSRRSVESRAKMADRHRAAIAKAVRECRHLDNANEIARYYLDRAMKDDDLAEVIQRCNRFGTLTEPTQSKPSRSASGRTSSARNRHANGGSRNRRS